MNTVIVYVYCPSPSIMVSTDIKQQIVIRLFMFTSDAHKEREQKQKIAKNKHIHKNIFNIFIQNMS